MWVGLGSLSWCTSSLCQVLAAGQMASHLTLNYSGIQRSSRSTQSLQSPAAAKQATIITPLLPCLTVGVQHSCSYPVVFTIWPSFSTLVLLVQRTLFNKCCGIFKGNDANVSCDTIFLLERRGFLLVKPADNPYSVLLLYILLIETCEI